MSLHVYFFLILLDAVQSVRYGKVDEVIEGSAHDNNCRVHGHINLTKSVASLPDRIIINATLATEH